MSFVRVDSGLLYRGAHPYRYVGANLWSAAWLPPERLARELDRLIAAGVSNVRIMASAEGGVGRSSHIEPPMQPTIGEYDETVLRGLDAAVHQIGARGMTAVLVLGNMWQWSGGFASYVAWATGESAPLMTSTAQDADWQAHQDFASRFYGSAAAVQAWRGYVEHLLGRTNSASGVPYAADETIMAWQLCNEPRPLTHGREYLAWIEASAALLKSLAPHTLVSLGSEGPTPWPRYSGTDVRRDHAHVDYVSIHMWPQNWQWYDPAHASVQAATSKSLEYAAQALRQAKWLGKPLVVDEFGLARDGGSLDPAAATAHRDVYYGAMCEGLAALGPEMAGLNFWAWGGEARPGDGAFIGDPPHEPQGWYSVYDADASTKTVLQLCATLFAPAPAPPPASQCRSDICTDDGNDCCAPGNEERGCSPTGYGPHNHNPYTPQPGGTSSTTYCLSSFGPDAIYQCCTPGPAAPPPPSPPPPPAPPPPPPPPPPPTPPPSTPPPVSPGARSALDLAHPSSAGDVVVLSLVAVIGWVMLLVGCVYGRRWFKRRSERLMATNTRFRSLWNVVARVLPAGATDAEMSVFERAAPGGGAGDAPATGTRRPGRRPSRRAGRPRRGPHSTLLDEAPRSEGHDHKQREQHDDEEAPSSGDDGGVEREDPVWDAAGRI